MRRFLAISGSLRASSSNSALLHAMAEHAPSGCQIMISNHICTLPIFNPDDEGDGVPTGVASWIAAVSEADGIIVACPEYAHGIPGGLKNALDWLVSGEAAIGKPAMLVHASTRSLYARAALSEVMRTMSFVLLEDEPVEMPLLGVTADARARMLAEPDTISRLRAGLTAFSGFVEALQSDRPWA